MKITILCSDEKHPVNEYLSDWVDRHRANYNIELFRRRKDLKGGDLLFLISCNEIVRKEDREKFTKVLVIHASDLPQGRGWSPHIWKIVQGLGHFTVTLLEAEDKVDSGDIWHQVEVSVPQDALWDEINAQLFEAECLLMDFAAENFETVIPRPQDSNVEPTYYPKRTPADSEIDPNKSIADQFDLIRVCDPVRFPAYFKHRGATYSIRLEKQ
ncbi:MAG: formyltransferase family protein [Opitutaceae bacterium]